MSDCAHSVHVIARARENVCGGRTSTAQQRKTYLHREEIGAAKYVALVAASNALSAEEDNVAALSAARFLRQSKGIFIP